MHSVSFCILSYSISCIFCLILYSVHSVLFCILYILSYSAAPILSYSVLFYGSYSVLFCSYSTLLFCSYSVSFCLILSHSALCYILCYSPAVHSAALCCSMLFCRSLFYRYVALYHSAAMLLCVILPLHYPSNCY